MTLQLASEVGHGPATGTLSISGALTGGCLTGSGAGVGSITWADGSNPSWGSFSVQLVGTLLYLQGFVDTGTFANDVPQGVFSLAPDEPAACAGPGVSTASLTGQVGFATPS